MSTLTVPIESVAAKGNTAVHTRTRSSSFIRALADVQPQGEHSETFSAPILSVSGGVVREWVPYLTIHRTATPFLNYWITTANTLLNISQSSRLILVIPSPIALLLHIAALLICTNRSKA